MTRTTLIPFSFLLMALLAAGADEEIVFRSDVSLARVDAQVVDRQNRAILNLAVDDFVLVENGVRQGIKNFANEDMPVDFLVLLDVSGSMQSHVERVADASREALRALGPEDRVAIMVFDRMARVRMPFRKQRSEIQRGLEDVLRDENFNGGTDIARGLNAAINYIEREGRRDARRAIVILTDDQSEFATDQNGIVRAMSATNIVLSALLAPDAMRSGPLGTGGGWPGGGGGGGWPGSSDPLGGIIFGRRGPYGNRGPSIGMPRTDAAGTAEIARRSGGDSFRVDDASALQSTLERIRQRYALHFNASEAAKAGRSSDLELDLSAEARRRYPDAEVRYRRVLLSGSGSGLGTEEPVMISRGSQRVARAEQAGSPPASAAEPAKQQAPRSRGRRPGVSDDGAGNAGPIQPRTSDGGWRRSDDPAPAAPQTQTPAVNASEPAAPAPSAEPQPKQGGWRRVKPGEEP